MKLKMKKEININKKIIIILLLINVIIIGASTSYALFQTTIVSDNVVKIQVGTTEITTTINGYSNNLITLASGESKTLNITLSNITEYDILYQMYYTVESGTGTITTTELSSEAKGTMNNNKTLTITVQNNNASDITIKIATKGALINSSITLESNEYEFITDITPPVITVSAVNNNTISPKLSITSNEDGEYCVNTSSTTTDMSNCVFSASITADTAITTDVFTTASTYYVHVKDSAGNIGISGGVAISFYPTATEFATEKYGTGGLVAINTSGTLYSGSGTIREYRYSGASVNNYVFFDTDGDETQDSNEIWRIIGIFKNSSGKWNLKLMRNTMLTSSELPSTYTYNGTSYTIENGTSGYAYWNSVYDDKNDWTTAGLQYYLNATDGYFGKLASIAHSLVDTSYTYYLGNYGYNVDTAISSYISERKSTVCSSNIGIDSHINNCNIWYGNKATWKGKVALLYPSDYGYSASSIHWNSTTLYNWISTQANTSWMYKTTSHSKSEWLLSPSSSQYSLVAYWQEAGSVYNYSGSNGGVRPVLNLLSTSKIDANHTGSSSDPYVLILD